MGKIKTLFFILLLCCGISVTYADNQSALSKISAKIEQLKKSLFSQQNQKVNLNNELGKIETQINNVSVNLHQLNRKIKQQQKLLRPLEKKQQALQAKLKLQRQELAGQIQAAYQMGKHSAWQLFLSEQNPNNVTRMAMYSQVINQARSDLIVQYLQNLTAIEDNQNAINQVLNELQSLRAKQLAEQKVLKQKVKNRHVLIKSLDKKITSNKQHMQQLQANKKYLQGVINNLAAEKQYQQLSGKAFASLKHRLPWPVKGRITRNYGQLYDGRLRSNGVFISTVTNSPVRAVAAGQVLFAKWLRGYGNMIIISHRGNYMTLYAHNNAMLVQVGERVQPGQEIALSGNSGGLIEPGLYFEIRYRGKTRNPALWCH